MSGGVGRSACEAHDDCMFREAGAWYSTRPAQRGTCSRRFVPNLPMPLGVTYAATSGIEKSITLKE